jgi:hypothetical protein
MIKEYKNEIKSKYGLFLSRFFQYSIFPAVLSVIAMIVAFFVYSEGLTGGWIGWPRWIEQPFLMFIIMEFAVLFLTCGLIKDD